MVSRSVPAAPVTVVVKVLQSVPGLAVATTWPFQSTSTSWVDRDLSGRARRSKLRL